MNWQATAGRPYGLCVDYNLILTVNYHISTTIQRRQQATALPRRRLLRIFRNSLWGCLSLTTQLLLFRKNHALFACSVVNALTTAHCRYQLLRLSVDLFHNPSELPTATHLPLQGRKNMRLCEFNRKIITKNAHESERFYLT